MWSGILLSSVFYRKKNVQFIHSRTVACALATSVIAQTKQRSNNWNLMVSAVMCAVIKSRRSETIYLEKNGRVYTWISRRDRLFKTKNVACHSSIRFFVGKRSLRDHHLSVFHCPSVNCNICYRSTIVKLDDSTCAIRTNKIKLTTASQTVARIEIEFKSQSYQNFFVRIIIITDLRVVLSVIT